MLGRRWQPVGDFVSVDIAGETLATGAKSPGLRQWVTQTLATEGATT